MHINNCISYQVSSVVKGNCVPFKIAYYLLITCDKCNCKLKCKLAYHSFLSLSDTCGAPAAGNGITVGNMQIPNSSRFSTLLPTKLWPSRCENLLLKSSGLKCSEHIMEYCVGCHLARLSLTKLTHFLHLFLASFRSFPEYGICEEIHLFPYCLPCHNRQQHIFLAF